MSVQCNNSAVYGSYKCTKEALRSFSLGPKDGGKFSLPQHGFESYLGRRCSTNSPKPEAGMIQYCRYA
jgi:hypothetical protein